MFSCQQCSKFFPKKREFNQHMRVHTGENPYGCTVRGKSFARINHLNEHMRVHTGEKPYFCTLCGKSFSRSYILFSMKREFTQVLNQTAAQWVADYLHWVTNWISIWEFPQTKSHTGIVPHCVINRLHTASNWISIWEFTQAKNRTVAYCVANHLHWARTWQSTSGKSMLKKHKA
jgi:hypothetical protein